MRTRAGTVEQNIAKYLPDPPVFSSYEPKTQIIQGEAGYWLHGLETSGRHPMYIALLLYSVGQALVLPHRLAGPSYLVAFAILVVFRVHAEERMMIEQFGDESWRRSPQLNVLLPACGDENMPGEQALHATAPREFQLHWIRS